MHGLVGKLVQMKKKYEGRNRKMTNSDRWLKCYKRDPGLILILPPKLLGSGKVSMLTHTYTHKPLRKIKVTICNLKATADFNCDQIAGLVICKFRKSMVIP